jgi:hypothetical protein
VQPIRKEDIADVDIVDAYELASDGTPDATGLYLTVSCISTTSATKTIVGALPSDGEGYLYSVDHPVQVGDYVFLTGTSGGAANGKFTVATVASDTSVTVNETIADSTGGTIQFVYPEGASLVGFNPTGQSFTSAITVEQALLDIANALPPGTTITDQEHKTLPQLIHLADGQGGPFEGFTTNAVSITTGGAFPTSIIWYTDNTLLYKIVEKQITYNTNKTPATLYWAVYASDGVTVLATAADAITYSGAFETSRTRTLTDSPAPMFITAQQHKTLRQLIHLADGQGGPFEGFTSGAYRTTVGAAFPTAVTWYDSSLMAKKYVEKLITYTGQYQINTVTWNVYDVDGVTVLATVSDSVTYSTFFETSRVRSIT